MSDAREQILNTLRRGLQRGPVAGERRAELEARLAHPPRNVIPARALRPHFEQVDLFVQMARNAAATVDPVTHPADVPVAVSAFLDCEGLPAELVMAPDPELAALPWSEEPALHIERRAAVDGDQTSVSLAFAGIAETGTLVLASGADNPVTVSFLPENHIIVLDAATIVGSLEDGIALARSRLPGRIMPRTLNLISGASRTADIGGRLVLGAHGPRRLAVMIVADPASAGA